MTLNDHNLISEVLGRYYYCVDTKDSAGWLSLWADDGLLQNPPSEARGRKQLEKFAEDHIKDPAKRTRHMATNVFCELSGDEATATNYMLVIDSERQDAQHATAICHSRLVKVSGIWKLQSHVFQTDKSFDFSKVGQEHGAGSIAVQGTYELFNDGQDLSPELTIAKILGKDPNNRVGLVEIQGCTYLKRNLQTGEFEASSDPEVLGIQGQPAGFFVMKGSSTDLLFATEVAHGRVNADHSVENLGALTIIGGNGKYRGASGALTLSEKGTFTESGYHGSLTIRGRVSLT